MENFYEIDKLCPKIELKSVLKTMDCYEDSPVYEEVVEEYEDHYEEAMRLCDPVGVIGFGEIPAELANKKYPEGTKVIYAVMSVGNGLKEASTRAFQEGDYVCGMLYDAMADSALFSLDGRLVEKLREACSEHQVGIKRRLEAPHDISMKVQKVAWEYLNLKERFGIRISEGLMYDPVKTSCQVFVLTEDPEIFKAQHDCRNCPNLTCKMRNIPETEVTVQKDGKRNAFLLKDQESVMEGLIRNGYKFSAFCGGNGLCGKCKIRVTEGKTAISPEDRKIFSEEELRDGWRLSCKLFPKRDLTITFDLNDESDFEILTDHREEGNRDWTEGKTAEESAGAGSDGAENIGAERAGEYAEDSDIGYDIAVDIGTTTIAMQLLKGTTGKAVHTVTTINHQRAYGADVISRMQASMGGKKEALRQSIQTDLTEGIKRLLEESGVEAGKVRRVAIGGNTTMGHLLMGYDCDTLGVYPFTPVNIDFIEGSFQEILGNDLLDASTVLLPGISTYVGGDIVSGLLSLGFDSREQVCLLVDLGTNGEMALGNRDKIMVTSTAAGPAFEGGNISCGMGSVAGAICSVKIEDGTVSVKTIRDQAPVGLCGTGVVETVAELVKEEIVEDSGLLDEEYFEDGFPLAKDPEGKEIVFTQQDVREIQLAKAAVRGGVETLLVRYGISYDDVHKVYLAGGFGYKLDTEKAIAIGMFPEEFQGKIEAIGNSSLAGAVEYLTEQDSRERIGKILSVSTEINLSADKDFNEFYMDSMFFEKG